MRDWSAEREEQMVAFQAEAMRRLDNMKRERPPQHHPNVERAMVWCLVGYVLMIAALLLMVWIA